MREVLKSKRPKLPGRRQSSIASALWPLDVQLRCAQAPEGKRLEKRVSVSPDFGFRSTPSGLDNCNADSAACRCVRNGSECSGRKQVRQKDV